MQEAFLNEPKFSEPNHASVVLTLENTLLSRKVRKEEIRKNDFDPTELPEKQLLVYGIIKANEGLNTSKISYILGINRNSVDTAIKALRSKNIIEFRGTNRTGGYYILK